jgi:hypothetical protein
MGRCRHLQCLFPARQPLCRALQHRIPIEVDLGLDHPHASLILTPSSVLAMWELLLHVPHGAGLLHEGAQELQTSWSCIMAQDAEGILDLQAP